MGWSIGFDGNWKRDIGYGVPAVCDHPDCSEKIDRGLAYVCAGERPYGGDGCGLFFCAKHRSHSFPLPEDSDDPEAAEVYEKTEKRGPCCERCAAGLDPFEAKPDVKKWIRWKLNHSSWQQWRDEHPEEVAAMRAALKA